MTTAFFSILELGKGILTNPGVYKGFIRYHLGLLIPEPSEECRIRVDEPYAHWEEGKSMMFDDTYNHEVWNNRRTARYPFYGYYSSHAVPR